MARRTDDGSNPASFVQDALRYADRTANDPRAASLHARLGCQRFLADHRAAQRSDTEWCFDELAAVRAMHFAQLMPNIKGPLAGKPLRLMDWQKLAYANIFGFKSRADKTRRFRYGGIFVPKGNGKTTISAPLAMYMTFGEGEGGAEGYAAAVTRDQARILFDVAQEMVRRTPEMQREWGVGVLKHSIYQQRTASSLKPLSSDAKSLDGLNVAVAICDEIGSHRTAEVFEALKSAMGKREQPFLLSISTATGNASGIGRVVWDQVLRILRGDLSDDRMFGIIYSIDDEDDPWDEATLVKANPGWGVSVQPEGVLANMRQARHNAALEANFMTRHLNMWIGADEQLFSTRAWLACADQGLDLQDFAGRECHIALDLASKSDLAAMVAVFPLEDHYTVFARCYLNEGAVDEARNPSYPIWAADGSLVVTPGNETDYSVIEADVIDWARLFRVKSVAFDPWGSTQLAQRLTAQGIPMVEFRAVTQNVSEPTKELEAAMRGRRIRHDGNALLTWCIGNVVGHYDARGNVFPRKARPENKIDAAWALIAAIARCMIPPAQSVYETRGLITLG